MDKDSKIRLLEEEIKYLRDENSSLWDMLEEIQNSDKSIQELLDDPTIEMALGILAVNSVGDA